MSDFEAYRELVTRLEWVELSLKGTDDSPGLLYQLEQLTGDGRSGSETSLLEQMTALVERSDEAVERAASVHEKLSGPVSQEMQLSIEAAVREAVQNGGGQLQEQAETFKQVVEQHGSNITSSAAQAELMSRTIMDSVSSVQDELERTSGRVAGQFESMLKEVSETLSPEALYDPLRDAARAAIRKASVDVNTENLENAHKKALDEIGEKLKEDMRQYQRGLQTEMAEVQKEASERVQKIISGRAPSQAIIELYDKLEVVEAENSKLKKSLRGAKRSEPESGNTSTGYSKRVVAWACGVSVVCGAVFWALAGSFVAF